MIASALNVWKSVVIKKWIIKNIILEKNIKLIVSKKTYTHENLFILRNFVKNVRNWTRNKGLNETRFVDRFLTKKNQPKIQSLFIMKIYFLTDTGPKKVRSRTVCPFHGNFAPRLFFLRFSFFDINSSAIIRMDL